MLSRKLALPALFALMSVPAAADSFTATVVAIDPATGIVELHDKSKISPDAKIIEGKIEVGSILLVEFNGTENGFEPMKLVRVMNPSAARPKTN